jgi:2-methylcitrate dehydratase PrpD
MSLASTLAAFAIDARIPDDARRRAHTAWVDTIGVILAGSVEPPARIVQQLACAEGGHARCHVLGVDLATSASLAAFANGTAAHALDYDDMCFVSLAHPSATLVPAALAAGELAGASGRAILDAYVVGFEVEAVLGRAMNPSHYARGWHCTSTLGAVGAAAVAARLLGLDAGRACHALGIAASSASGLKENFGTMTKPLHAGLAARDGVAAALLARDGFTASPAALDGAQGLIVAASDATDTCVAAADVGQRWEIIETGITMKLYPSCAATHPALDAILDLRRAHDLTARAGRSVTVMVDAVTPTVLLYPAPENGLQAKFSMQYCAAAALVLGRVGIDAFGGAVHDAAIRDLMARVTMTVDPDLGRTAPSLTQARVELALADGRVLSAVADGARGYPSRPAPDAAVHDKFVDCARRALASERAEGAWLAARELPTVPDIRAFVDRLRRAP